MRFSLPDHPSLLRKTLLAPATLTYVAGSALHRALWLRPTPQSDAPLPLIVIGSLRAGGAGKTPVTLELARWLSAQGYRTGILAFSLPRKKFLQGVRESASGCTEVFPDSDWRESSDEAVLLARSVRDCGARVFVTRDRARARAALARAGEFDVLVADDGLMDTRLRDGRRGRSSNSRNVLTVALARPEDRPTLWDLLPAGAWRLTASALRHVDVVLREDQDFSRAAVLPHTGWPTPPPPAWVLTGLGNPARFLQSLSILGFEIAGASHGPDHGLPDLERAFRSARRQGVEHFMCSAKDWIKLEGHSRRPRWLLRVDETVTLDPGFLARVKAFLASPTS